MKNHPRRLAVFLFSLVIASAICTTTFANKGDSSLAPPANDNFASAEELSGIRVSIVRANINATKEVSEPNHAGNVGGRSVWFKWTAPMSRVMKFSTGRSNDNIDTLLNIYTGSSLGALTSQGFSDSIHSTNRRSFARVKVDAGTTYYIAVDGKSFPDLPIEEGTFTLDIQPSLQFQGADYDQDGMTDAAVFRPSTGTWFVRMAGFSIPMDVVNWGASGDIPVVASHNGNGASERIIFRPSDGYWYRRAFNGALHYRRWGANGDIPIADQFDGGPYTEFAVFRPSTGVWHIEYPGSAEQYYRFGMAGDLPVPGQYSPDHFADIAVFRPSNGTWYFMVRRSNNQTQDSFRAIQFGLAGDKPVPGDYDGDGVLDVAVYRPSTGTWYVLRSSDNQVQTAHFGLPTDIPSTGDYNGDGIFDYAVFRPSTGTWYIARPTGIPAQNFDVIYFGQNGDIPMTSNNGR